MKLRFTKKGLTDEKNPYFTISHQNIWFWSGTLFVFVCCIMAVVPMGADLDEKLAEFERIMGLDGQPWKSVRPLFENKTGVVGWLKSYTWIELQESWNIWNHFVSLCKRLLRTSSA